jgi:dTDP-4-dehydrorhamnose reductase
VLGLSSHRVFDGWSQQPYREHDPPDATDSNGLCWLELERTLARIAPRALILRTGLVLDLERLDDPRAWLASAFREHRASAADGEQWSPVWLPDLIHVALDLLVDAEAGVWHLAPERACSALELRRRLASRAGVSFAPSSSRLEPPSRGPMHALSSNRGWPLLDLEATLERALAVVERAPHAMAKVG